MLVGAFELKAFDSVSLVCLRVSVLIICWLLCTDDVTFIDFMTLKETTDILLEEIQCFSSMFHLYTVC